MQQHFQHATSTVFAPEYSEGSWPALKYNNLQADGKAEIAISLFPYLHALRKEKAELELILTFSHLCFPFLSALLPPAYFCRLKRIKMSHLCFSWCPTSSPKEHRLPKATQGSVCRAPLSSSKDLSLLSFCKDRNQLFSRR